MTEATGTEDGEKTGTALTGKGEPMSDTISRQAAIDAVKKNTFRLTFAEEQNCEGHVAWSAEAVYSDVMEGALLDLPSAQPDITRCKDCRYYRWESDMCDYPYATAQNVVHEDDFCSKAERRQDGNS